MQTCLSKTERFFQQLPFARQVLKKQESALFRKSKLIAVSFLMLITGLLSSISAVAQVSNYTFAPSSGTFTPLTGGTAVSAIQADGAISGNLAIGFSFVFDGVTYTNVRASS